MRALLFVFHGISDGESTKRVKGDFVTLIPIRNVSNHATIARYKDKDENF